MSVKVGATTYNSKTAREIGHLVVTDGLSTRAVIARYPQLSPVTIRAYVRQAFKEAGLPPPQRKWDRYDNYPVISPLHTHISRRLIALRARRGEDMRAFCSRTGLTTYSRLPLYEAGKHDFTLSELIKIAELSQQPLEEFIMEKVRACQTK
jgi:hypothetical protein